MILLSPFSIFELGIKKGEAKKVEVAPLVERLEEMTSGATILGTGKVALVVDVGSLL